MSYLFWSLWVIEAGLIALAIRGWCNKWAKVKKEKT